MATVYSQRTRVQTKLVELAKAASFPVVEYEHDGTPQPISDRQVLKANTPVLVNEVEATFSEDDSHRRSFRDQRDSWQFLMRLQFSREVLLETFENDLIDNPPIVEAANGLSQVTLHLVSTDAEHPVQRNASSGTSVDMIFEAAPARN